MILTVTTLGPDMGNRIRVGGSPNVLPAFLTADEADDLLEQLDDAIRKVRDAESGPYVQVRFVGSSSYLYTYRDPSGDLNVGDLVNAPVGGDGETSLARVEALGRGSYAGPTKEITERFVTEDLV